MQVSSEKFNMIIPLALSLLLGGCQSKLQVDIASNTNKISAIANPIPSPINTAATIALVAPGNPTSFKVSTAEQTKAQVTWGSPPSGGVGPVTQTVFFYSDDNTTCSGAANESVNVSSSLSTLSWDRFANTIKGFVRFKITATDASGATASSACSGSINLRNGIVSLSGNLANLGLFYSGAADINGDGVKDIIAKNDYYNNSQGVIVVFASVAGSVTNRATYIYTGDADNDQLGTNLQTIDITGDGIVDIVSSNGFAEPGGRSGAGSIYVIQGAHSLPSSGAITTAGYRYDGDSAGDNMGTSYSMYFKDLTGDNIPEIIASEPSTGVNRGSIYIIPGGSTPPPSGAISVAGKRYNGNNATDSSLAQDTAFEDVTGDGYLDIITHDPWAKNGGSSTRGCISIIPGGATLPNSGSITAVGKSYCENADTQYLALYHSVITDVNGDGIKDIISSSYAGAYIIFGAAYASLPASGAIATQANRVYTGFTASSMPYFESYDLTGDGLPEVILSDSKASPGAKSNAGSVYILLGGAIPASGAISTVKYRQYDGENINDGLQFRLGYNNRIDLNNDGYVDLLSYNPQASPGARANAGSIYFIPGGNPLPASGAISAIGKRYDGDNASDQLSIRGLADVTGDNRKDLILSGSSNGFLGIVPSSATMPVSGTLSSAGKRYDGAAGYSAVLSTSVDLNADGKFELLTSNCIFNGTSSLPASAPLTTVSTCFAGTTIISTSADINGDGYLDLGIFNTTNPEIVSVVYGNASLSGLSVSTIAQPSWGDSDNSNLGPSLIDLDGDGKAEVIWSVSTENANGVVGSGAVYMMPSKMVYTQ